MPSLPDSIFLFVLALLLFGPKRLPVLARELGKWVGEFRRASNEFKMQMEEELRISEQTDRKKQIAAMEAAAPVTPAIEEHKILDEQTMEIAATSGAESDAVAEVTATETAVIEAVPEKDSVGTIRDAARDTTRDTTFDRAETVDGVRAPLPIATSGDMRLMPPATGLPVGRNGSGAHAAATADAGSDAASESGDALDSLLGSIPAVTEEGSEAAAEATAHGH